MDDRKKLGMDFADPMNRSEWRRRLRGRLVKQLFNNNLIIALLHGTFVTKPVLIRWKRFKKGP